MNASSKSRDANARLYFKKIFSLKTFFFSFIFARQFYVPATIILLVMIVVTVVFVSPSLLPKPSIFPPLCNSNLQPAKTGTVPTPATDTLPDEEPIGLSEGATIFDLNRPNPQEVQDKLQAAQDWVNNFQDVVSSLTHAISIDPTDAEAQIYLENWKVLKSNHPYITFVVGVDFSPSSVDESPVDYTGTSQSTLQAVFTAQKECNNQSQQSGGKIQIVLMVANIGGKNSDNRASSAKFVADQIADQTSKDLTIVGIVGWVMSADSINVNHQLKIRGSHLPMISPSSSSDELEGMSNFFRICPTDVKQAQIAANFVLKTKQKKRIAILYDQTTSYGNNLATDFAKNIPSNRDIGAVPFTGGDSETVRDALTKILAQKPDAVLFAGYVSDLVALLNTLPQPNNLLIVGGDTPANTNDYPNPLPDMHNVYFTAFASPNQWVGADSKPPFFQEYRTNFGTVTAPTGLPSIDVSVMLGYDAMLTLLYGSQQALSKHNNTILPSYLENELKQITAANPIQGVTGRIAFDSNGNQDQSKMIFVEHIDGHKLVIDEKHGCLLKDNCDS